ncbi:sulfur carrier protein ThiS [Shewanella psychrophila]|uniref:Sulfur carrier protein ThiS n=1 Tax=Shewanella psychrophila TaxID=225848 RepID=A0A1S6HLG0_9GAMM|nr:sulfur carrier protein ThiS [Shewanella psychrophila]AQS36353.1 sulfur carrier protein ThiS [Shewanella psychrophila]
MSHKIPENNISEASIKVMLNDELTVLTNDLSIQSLLLQQNIAANSVAVVCNGQVLPKSRWEGTLCRHGDKFEVFALVAGG